MPTNRSNHGGSDMDGAPRRSRPRRGPADAEQASDEQAIAEKPARKQPAPASPQPTSAEPQPQGDDATTPPAPEGITVRPVRPSDLVDGAQVYALRDHAGALSLDPATLSHVQNIGVHRGESWDKNRPRVGDRIEARMTTVYGVQTTVSLFNTREALDVKYPTTRFPEDRERALANQADPGAYVADPDGDRTLPITPDWGAYATVSLLVPDISAEDLREALARVLTEKFPGARVPKVQTRPAADRRVNLYRRDYGTYTKSGFEHRDVPMALHILEAEAPAHFSGGADTVEHVHPDAPRPVVGG